jgi:DNA adenine methylase
MTISPTRQQLKPILKWAGGKRQVLPYIRPLVPEEYARYIEPFLGGGAVLFDLVPSSAVVNDINSELISMYQVIKDDPEGLISMLSSFTVSKKFFDSIRKWDRDEREFALRTATEKAARTIFLNRTGFNGLYRVNSRNEFNVPFGRHVNPKVCDEESIRCTSTYFNTARVEFRNEDFRQTIDRSKAGDFIYVDPPYAPLDEAATTFTSYTSGGFGLQDLADLREALDAANARGATWVMSNVKSRQTARLFPKSRYRVIEVQVSRPINSNGEGRGAVSEILVTQK